MSRAANVLVHMDLTDSGSVVWWAESDSIPGFSAAADTLSELKALVQEAAEHHLGPEPDLTWELVAEDLALDPSSKSERIAIEEPLVVSSGSALPIRGSVFVH